MAVVVAKRQTQITVTWPHGFDGDWSLSLEGEDSGQVNNRDNPNFKTECKFLMDAGNILTADRSIERHHPLKAISGLRVGKGFRRKVELTSLFPGELSYQLADDLPIAALVAQWVIGSWESVREANLHAASLPRNDVCVGLRALEFDGEIAGSFPFKCRRTAAVEGGAFSQHITPWFRRTRKLVLSKANWGYFLKAELKDCGMTRNDGLRTIHEYRIDTTLDDCLVIKEMRVAGVQLPFGSCAAASDKIGELIGIDTRILRRDAHLLVGGASGCTHLSDVVRTIGDANWLLGRG